LHGPVRLKFGGWTFSSSREALVTAKSRIVVRDGTLKSVSANEESGVVVDLATGGILRSGPGW